MPSNRLIQFAKEHNLEVSDPKLTLILMNELSNLKKKIGKLGG